MRVKYHGQEHNTMSPTRARTWTARSKDECINPLPSAAFCQKMRVFFDILVVFRLDFGQISFDLVQKAFATLAFWVQACAEIKILRFLDEKVTYVFKLFDF